MSDNVEKIEKTSPVEGDVEENDADLSEDYDEDYDEDEDWEDEDELYENEGDVCKKSRRFRNFFTKEGFPRLAIYVRYLFPLFTGLLLFVLAFADLFEFYQGATVGSISLFGLFGATFGAAFRAFTQGGQGAVVWYAVLQLVGVLIATVAFLLAGGFAILAAVTSCRTFSREPNDPLGNRMKVVFKFVFPNRICLFLANAAYIVPFLYPYYFAFVLERFYYMGVEPEPPIYVKSHPCFWIAVALTAVTLVLAIAISGHERKKRMNMFLVEHNGEEDADEKISD